MTTSSKKICIATSTRADWGLLSPIAKALRAEGAQVQILATNMHLMPRYGLTVSEIIADGFEPAARVEMDYDDDSPASRAHAMAQCLDGTASALSALQPDLIVILGDRYEMLAVASAAAVMRVPIVHIAGGEISEGAIDDSLRHAITKLSALHLTAAEPYRRRVIQMGENPDRVLNTGAIGVWKIANTPRLSGAEMRRRLSFDFEPGQFLLVTYHPVTTETVSPALRTRELLQALDMHPDMKVLITYPNNDAGSEAIIEEITAYAAAQPERVKLVQSLGSDGYLAMASMAAAVVGNSSSGIVEVPSLGVCTVDVGARQRGRLAGPSVIHCGDMAQDISNAIAVAISPAMRDMAAKKENPYFKPDTLQLITGAILDADPAELAHKTFYDHA